MLVAVYQYVEMRDGTSLAVMVRPPTKFLVYNIILRSREHASRMVLPWVREIDIPETEVSATALRGQPSRSTQLAGNGG